MALMKTAQILKVNVSSGYIRNCIYAANKYYTKRKE